LVWFEIVTIFQNETQNFTKYVDLQNKLFIQNWLSKNIWNIWVTIYTINKNFKIFRLKIPLYENMFFLSKGAQKGH
jgi:hypothetical protein